MSHQKQDIDRPSKRPTTDDRTAWRIYWHTEKQPWRTEPEIDPERQEELKNCRTIVPNFKKGIYPFQGMKLERADVEWLLATHEHGRGPVNWSEETEREREGLDVRGADLCQVNLSFLPLTRLRGGLTGREGSGLTEEQRTMAIVRMEKADLSGAKLERANLSEAKLEGAYLSEAKLEGANLREAKLEGAKLSWAELEGAYLWGAKLEGAYLGGAKLEGANLSGAKLERAYLGEAKLERANLSMAKLERAELREAKLEGAKLERAELERANLWGPG